MSSEREIPGWGHHDLVHVRAQSPFGDRRAIERADGPGCRVSGIREARLPRRLPHLASAGITSFKIEGRLKDADYVRNVVSYYRRELDKVIAKKGCSRPSLAAAG